MLGSFRLDTQLPFFYTYHTKKRLLIKEMKGELFEPVPGLTFDLIISNPPFVISPEMRYMYRDSGMQGDQVSRNIARQAPQFLTNILPRQRGA